MHDDRNPTLPPPGVLLEVQRERALREALRRGEANKAAISRALALEAIQEEAWVPRGDHAPPEDVLIELVTWHLGGHDDEGVDW